MTQFYYFTYGSNMLVGRLQERCPSAQFVCPAYVCGYELRFSKRSKDCSGKATIVESEGPNYKLYGALFQIDNAELPELEKAEGLGYKRWDDFVVVKMDNNQEMGVTTYFAKSGATGRNLKPYRWYKQLVLWGAIQAKLPSSYLVKLVAIEADHDHDSQRNDRALSLLRKTTIGLFPEENWDMKIADQYTVADWKAVKTILAKDKPGKTDKDKKGEFEITGEPTDWEQAFNLFFRKRIETRYFEPIRLLQEHGENKGEGFSIVALQCSLIEFLASVADTTNCACEKPNPSKKKCKHCKIETVCKKCQTCDSKIISDAKRFTGFLHGHSPFKEEFSSSDIANSFFADVRCALLHDARTKGNWKIRADSDDNKVIVWKGKNSEKILFRNNLQNAFEQYINEYGKDLAECKKLQEAFIRKFDRLCEE